MEKQPLNPWAKDKNGNFVSIEHAQKGQEYFCPKCNEPLTYRKKGDGPRAHQDHFSHRPDSECKGYTPHESESEIHKFAKYGICDILLSAIESGTDITITWACPSCGKELSANLVKRAKTAVVEKYMGDAKADVALLDENEKVLSAIEIVYKHDVADKTLTFYEDNSIVVIRIVIHSAEDCNDLMHKLQNPDSVNVCFNKSCPLCQSSQAKRQYIKILNGEKKLVGFAVGMENPFDGNLIKGMPFTDQERQKLKEIVENKWPHLRLHFYEEAVIPHAMLELKQTVNQQTRPHSRFRGSKIDYYEAKMEKPQSNYRYSSNQGKKSGTTKKYGAKKTGGKRRR